ncbi:MAG: YCF48-related protein [bacterium]|nr:YCF48-related protein [bacterium]
MRKLLLSVLGTLLVVLFVRVSDAHAQVWTTLTSGVTNDLNDIDCVDERTCYTVGGAPFIGGPGVVLKTTNGGDSWTTQPIPTTNPLRGISCSSPTICYAAGDDGTLLKTTNGGTTWVAQSAPNLSTFPGQSQPWFWDIWAPTDSTAVAVGNAGAVYRTTTGGATWTQLLLGLENDNLSGVFFVNATTGWLTGATGLIHKTTDGGATWTAHVAHSGTPTLTFSDVSSLDGTTVWASGPFTFVAKSTDGGVSWTQISVPPTGGFPVVRFLNATTGWMGGNGGYLTTTDGGATWMLTFTNVFERSIDCVGGTICYMVGDDGTIRRYGTASAPTAATETPAASPAPVTPATQADLTIGDRSLTCPAGELGLEFAEYRYSIVVQNTGTADAGPFSMRLEGLVGSSIVGTPITRTVAALAAGASTTITGQANVGFFNPTAAAFVTVRVTTDALGQVAESNETNNAATIEQTCVTAPATPTTTETKPDVMTTVPPVVVVAPATNTTTTGTTTGTDQKTDTSVMDAQPTVAPQKTGDVAAPIEPTLTKDLSPEEKEAFLQAKNEERRLQIEKIQTDAPTVLLGIEKVIEKKAIARDFEKEDFAAQKVEFIAKAAFSTMSLEKKEQIQEAMKAFIAYGAPTKSEVLSKPIEKLGDGERAGVVNSFKEAFGKLPETSQDWEDIMKISIGRFPSQTNVAREQVAEASFKKIYKRAPLRTQANDNACVVVITYGLRPDVRRLAAEAVAIKTYKSVFKKGPKSASDWDTVRCIAYSGAKR